MKKYINSVRAYSERKFLNLPVVKGCCLKGMKGQSKKVYLIGNFFKVKPEDKVAPKEITILKQNSMLRNATTSITPVLIKTHEDSPEKLNSVLVKSSLSPVISSKTNTSRKLHHVEKKANSEKKLNNASYQGHKKLFFYQRANISTKDSRDNASLESLVCDRKNLKSFHSNKHKIANIGNSIKKRLWSIRGSLVT